MANQPWLRALQKLPPETLATVQAELASAPPYVVWTKLRPFLPGEPVSGREFRCGGDWPLSSKGKTIPCVGTPTHIRYATGGIAHGLDVVMCGPCAEKFADPSFDWLGPLKSRLP